LRTVKSEKDIFKYAEIFLAGMKAQWDEGGGRTMLGDNTGGVPSCCGQSCYSVLEFGFHMDSLHMHIYGSWLHAQSVPKCANFPLLRNFRNLTTAEFGEFLCKF